MEKKTYQLISAVEDYHDFKNKKLNSTAIMTASSHQFCFFTSEACLNQDTIPYRKRDFFKVSYLRGDYIIHYGDESIRVKGASLSIFSPSVSYTIEALEEEYNAGYFIFTDYFYNDFFKSTITQFPLFKNGVKTIYPLDTEKEKRTQELFDKIQELAKSDYQYRFDLIRNTISELLHYANTLTPSAEQAHSMSARERLVNVFNEMLENQFPADLHDDTQLLRTAGDFADQLNVHVNYLNRVTKEITGKTSRDHIYERFLKESLILLNHSSWSIAEIAYSLGYKDVSHFNHFFKKMTNTRPSDYRKR
jgi:AraC-like DNA-binding protein